MKALGGGFQFWGKQEVLQRSKLSKTLRVEALEERRLLSASSWESGVDGRDSMEGASENEYVSTTLTEEMTSNATEEAVAEIAESMATNIDATLIEAGQTLEALDEDFVFNLNSNLGAEYTIYLDFTGHKTTGTTWNRDFASVIDTPVFSLDEDYNHFSNQELRVIYEAWLVVAEDFMPFDVNVTTVEPEEMGQGAVRICVGGTNDWYGGGNVAGVACLTSFNYDTDTPAFVFAEEYQVKSTTGLLIGNTIAHEAGHTMGAIHGTNNREWYYDGHANWSPIMGGSDRILNQWSTTEYYNVSRDVYPGDLEIITSKYVPYRADDHSDNMADATELEFTTTDTVWGSGIIERNTDVDYFKLTLGETDNFSDLLDSALIIGGIEGITNLDVLVNLYDEDGELVLSKDSTSTLYACIGLEELAKLEAGTYYLSVEGTGRELAGNIAYTDYGSLGAYTIQVGSLIPDGGDIPGKMADAIPIRFVDGVYSGTATIGDDEENDGMKYPDSSATYFLDVDMYRFQVTEEDVNTRYTISLDSGDETTISTEIRIFDADGKEVLNYQIYKKTSGSVDFMPEIAGTYYLGISNVLNNEYDPMTWENASASRVKYKFSANMTIEREELELVAPVLEVGNVDADTIRVEWEQVKNAASYILEYKSVDETEWRQISGITGASKTAKNDGSEGNIEEVNEILSVEIACDPKQEYEVRALAVGENPYKDSGYSNIVSVTTPTLLLEGATLEGQKVGVNRKITASLAQENATASYQWYRGTDAQDVNTLIDGATDRTYLTTTADEGYFLKVVITGVGATEGTVEVVTDKATVCETLSELTFTTSQNCVGDVKNFGYVATSVTEWDSICAEVRLKDTDFGAGETLTHSLTYDSAYYQLDLDSLRIAEGWNWKVSQEKGADGQVTATFSFTATTYETANQYVLASVTLLPTGVGIGENTDFMGITVQKMNYDMNGDGEIEIGDLVTFARHFETSDTCADFNGDGNVTIMDLVEFSRQFGKKKPKMSVTESEIETLEICESSVVQSTTLPVSVYVRDAVFAEMKEDEWEIDWRMLEQG